jgi:hypothetical protein
MSALKIDKQFLRANGPTDYREFVNMLGGHSLTKLVPVALHWSAYGKIAGNSVQLPEL